MPSAARLRDQIEDSLSSRFSGALSPRARTPPPQIPCGVAALDAMLSGGLPAGVLTEFVGSDCSGRTTAALAYTAAVIQAGGVCAWIDVADALDPESAAASGVDLERLLWVRCGGRPGAELQQRTETQAATGVVSSCLVSARHAGGGSPHPRSEARDMPQAVGALMAAHGGLYDKEARRVKRSVGTPGAPNRPLSYRSEQREEQVNSDRLPPRRGDNLALRPRCAEPQPRRTAQISAVDAPLNATAGALRPGVRRAARPWPVLDQALRVTDLLLQGGGFSTIVLDLGSTAPEAAWRIPLATWFRFRAACERTRVSLVLLTQHPCARSSAEVVIRLEVGAMESQNGVMTGARYQPVVQRNRSHESEARVVSIRKPPQSVAPGAWRSEAAWAQAR